MRLMSELLLSELLSDVIQYRNPSWLHALEDHRAPYPEGLLEFALRRGYHNRHQWLTAKSVCCSWLH